MITAEEARQITGSGLAKKKAKTLQYLAEIDTWSKIKEEAEKGNAFVLIWVNDYYLSSVIEILEYQGFTVKSINEAINNYVYNLKICW